MHFRSVPLEEELAYVSAALRAIDHVLELNQEDDFRLFRAALVERYLQLLELRERPFDQDA